MWNWRERRERTQGGSQCHPGPRGSGRDRCQEVRGVRKEWVDSVPGPACQELGGCHSHSTTRKQLNNHQRTELPRQTTASEM